jgi:hypothetical protein
MNNAVDVIFKLKEKLSAKDVEIDSLEAMLHAERKLKETYKQMLFECGYMLLEE